MVVVEMVRSKHICPKKRGSKVGRRKKSHHFLKLLFPLEILRSTFRPFCHAILRGRDSRELSPRKREKEVDFVSSCVPGGFCLCLWWVLSLSLMGFASVCGGFASCFSGVLSLVSVSSGLCLCLWSLALVGFVYVSGEFGFFFGGVMSLSLVGYVSVSGSFCLCFCWVLFHSQILVRLSHCLCGLLLCLIFVPNVCFKPSSHSTTNS